MLTKSGPRSNKFFYCDNAVMSDRNNYMLGVKLIRLGLNQMTNNALVHPVI